MFWRLLTPDIRAHIMGFLTIKEAEDWCKSDWEHLRDTISHKTHRMRVARMMALMIQIQLFHHNKPYIERKDMDTAWVEHCQEIIKQLRGSDNVVVSLFTDLRDIKRFRPSSRGVLQ